MPDLPKVRQEYEADVRGYSGPLRAAGNEADRFSDKNSKAALAARKMGIAAKEAADKAAKSMSLAGEAAEKLAMGEIKAEEAAEAEAKALKDMERAAIAAAEAEHAVARAAEDAARNERQAARDAELAGAAQKLAALKAAGAVREHNAEVLRLRREMPELEKVSGDAFKLMESASNKFGSGLDSLTSGMEELQGIGRAVPSAILVGLQLLPAAASVAGGAITLGLGGALSLVGLKAQMANKDVRKSFADTRAAVVDDLHHISEPFHQTLLTISADAKRTWYGLSPTLETAFAKMAPAVTRFSSSLGDAFQELNPAIESVGTAFSRTLDQLGARAPAIMGNIGTSIKAITDAVAANPDALPSFIQDLSELARYGGDAVGGLIRLSSYMKNFAETANAAALGPVGDLALGILKLSHVSRDSGSGFQVVTKTFPTFAQQAIVAASGAHHLMTAEQAAALGADQLKTAMDNLTSGALNQRESMIAYRESVAQLTKTLKENGAAHGFNSAKGRENEQALDAVAVNAQKAAQGMKADGKSAQEVSAYLEGARRTLIAAAEKMGYSSARARELASQLLGVTRAANTIPSGKRITLNDNTASVRAHIAALQRSITNLHGKTVTIDYVERVHRTLQAERARADGGIDRYADGGMRRDLDPFIATVPTVLFGETETGGEAYIPLGESKRARSTDLLGQVADMFGLELVKPLADGVIEKYAKGKGPSKAQKARAAATIAHATARPEYLAALAAQHALEAMRSSVYGGMFRGGASTLGSAHGSVVQHVTNVTHVHVAGSVWELTKLTQAVQQSLVVNRMPVTMPGKRF